MFEGELESTLFEKFCRAQHLKALISTHALPSMLHELVEIYRDEFHKDIRGTRLSDALAHDEMFQQLPEEVSWTKHDLTPLHPTVACLLNDWLKENGGLLHHIPVSREGHRRSKVIRLGQRFTVTSESISDSHVVFHRREGGASWEAGAIQDLFSHTRELADGSRVTQTFAVIAAYKSLGRNEKSLDSY